MQCEKMALTALVKLLPPSHYFLFGLWERCSRELSRQELYEYCRSCKAKPAGYADGLG
jgi:hypothetical protein